MVIVIIDILCKSKFDGGVTMAAGLSRRAQAPGDNFGPTSAEAV
jgi:hypothetical protein